MDYVQIAGISVEDYKTNMITGKTMNNEISISLQNIEHLIQLTVLRGLDSKKLFPE